jgi:hypothetical protein
MLDKNPKWEKELTAYVSANPDNDRATYMLHMFKVDRILKAPYRLYLPEPTEATINILKQLTQTPPEKLVKPDKKDNTFTMALTAIEAPSSRLALEIFLHEVGNIQLHLVAEVQSPDPREPITGLSYTPETGFAPMTDIQAKPKNGLWNSFFSRFTGKQASDSRQNEQSVSDSRIRKERYRLWKYDGTTPAPAVPPPDKNTAEHVAVLASRPFDIDDWNSQSARISAKLGTKSIPDLMAVMVHPPERPRNFPIWNWIQHVQVAAALIIARSEGGWTGSERRNALLSLALGPMDWTTNAGIIALTQLALEDKSIRAEVINVFQHIIDSGMVNSNVCYADALVHCGLMLPDLPAATRQSLENMKTWVS